MSDFPDNFDFIIYGTGVTESILSAALSTTGFTVLHIDKNSFYGGYTPSFRLHELFENFNIWQENEATQDSINEGIFSNNNDIGIRNINFQWFVPSELVESNVEEIPNGNDHNCNNEESPTNHGYEKWIISLLKQRLRMVDFELLPKLILCESETVDKLIQSDVKRYLEFQFVSKFSSLSEDGKLLMMPVSRGDIVKTRLFSLRQKRQLTSFLEWALSVSLQEDSTIQKYSNLPLRDLMTNERSMDEFTQKIIIDCLILSAHNINTIQALEKLKRLLKSLNKIGPYPILWPNYGSGEIPQAFCRMSAVFGGIYSLGTSINSVNLQVPSENGTVHNVNNINEDVTMDTNTNAAPSIIPDIPKEQRKLKIELSNGSTVYTDRIFSHKSNFNPAIIQQNSNKKWISRCILVTNQSLVPSNDRRPHDVMLLPLNTSPTSEPIILLELPITKRNNDISDLYVVHMTLTSEEPISPSELFHNYIEKLFNKYNPEFQYNNNSNNEKPVILFECFFTLPDYTDVFIDFSTNNQYWHQMESLILPVTSCLDDLEFDCNFIEAEKLFCETCPSTQFLPSPPNPEDIIQVGNQAISTAVLSGDDPSVGISMEIDERGPEVPGDVVPNTQVEQEDPSLHLSSMLREIELEGRSDEMTTPDADVTVMQELTGTDVTAVQNEDL